jgi:hypothetical protein
MLLQIINMQGTVTFTQTSKLFNVKIAFQKLSWKKTLVTVPMNHFFP